MLWLPCVPRSPADSGLLASCLPPPPRRETRRLRCLHETPPLLPPLPGAAKGAAAPAAGGGSAAIFSAAALVAAAARRAALRLASAARAAARAATSFRRATLRQWGADGAPPDDGRSSPQSSSSAGASSAGDSSAADLPCGDEADATTADAVTLRLFVDGSAVECFTGDGCSVLSTRVYRLPPLRPAPAAGGDGSGEQANGGANSHRNGRRVVLSKAGYLYSPSGEDAFSEDSEEADEAPAAPIAASGGASSGAPGLQKGEEGTRSGVWATGLALGAALLGVFAALRPLSSGAAVKENEPTMTASPSAADPLCCGAHAPLGLALVAFAAGQREVGGAAAPPLPPPARSSGEQQRGGAGGDEVAAFVEVAQVWEMGSIWSSG